MSAKFSADCCQKLAWPDIDTNHTVASLIRPIGRIPNGLEATDMVPSLQMGSDFVFQDDG
jgi:hypothetical protein